MKLNSLQIIILAGIVFLAMLACLPIALIGIESGPAAARATQQAQATQLASTLQAFVTQNAVTPTSAPTQTPMAPTATSVPPTATFTATPVSYCGWVQFINDVSVPDGSVFSPGESFTKIWRLKNIGTCSWSPDTKLVFVSGERLNGPIAVSLPGYVAPGQTVDVAVSLTAPEENGHYVGYWMLRSSDGTLFGTGARAQNAFFVDIKVRRALDHGTVKGTFRYPSEFNPALTLYFENAATKDIIQFSIPENQITYSVLLPNGTYYAYAWAPGYNLEGAYVNTDRTLKIFEVRGGMTTEGIDISDWDVKAHSRGQ